MTDSVRTLIESRIDELESDPDSLIGDIKLSDFLLVLDARSGNGIWATACRTHVKNIRLILPLAETLDIYADLKRASEADFTAVRIGKTKWRFLLEYTSFLRLSPAYRAKVKRQLMALVQIQRAHKERYPPHIKCNGFVKVIPDKVGPRFQAAVVTDAAWKHTAASETELMENFMSSTATTDGDDAVVEKKIDPDVETLATWPDPKGLFAGISSLDEFVVNKDIQAFDVNNDIVHPARFPDVFRRGTWVIADVSLKFWDMSQPRRNQRLTDPSVTYQLFLNKIMALNVVQEISVTDVDVEASVPMSLPSKRSAPSEFDVDALLPAVTRPFTFRKADTDSHSAEGSSSFSGSADADIPKPGAPSKKAMGKARAKASRVDAMDQS